MSFFLWEIERHSSLGSKRHVAHLREQNKPKKDYHLKEGNHLDDSGSLQEESCMHCNKGNHSFAKNVARSS
jgi:hypothetical protein